MHALLVLSGSLSMTIQPLRVAVKGWIQNNTSRLCVTTNKVWTWKAQAHNSSISCDNTLLKEGRKKPRKLKTQSTGRSLFFSLKETENDSGWWWWFWLRLWFGSCTFHTLYMLNSLLFPHSADQGASFMPSMSKHLQRLRVLGLVLGLVAGSVFGEMTKTSRSSGIEEVKVKIFKGIQTHWGVCLTQMQWLFDCFCVWQFLHTFVFLWCKGKTPNFPFIWKCFL